MCRGQPSTLEISYQLRKSTKFHLEKKTYLIPWSRFTYQVSLWKCCFLTIPRNSAKFRCIWFCSRFHRDTQKQIPSPTTSSCTAAFCRPSFFSSIHAWPYDLGRVFLHLSFQWTTYLRHPCPMGNYSLTIFSRLFWRITVTNFEWNIVFHFGHFSSSVLSTSACRDPIHRVHLTYLAMVTCTMKSDPIALSHLESTWGVLGRPYYKRRSILATLHLQLM